MEKVRGRTVIVIVAALVWACDAGEFGADAMVDAGELLRDAGETLRDAGEDARDSGNTADAQVPPSSFDVPCDVERTERVEYPDSNLFFEVTRWYAELHDSSIVTSDIASVQTMSCGFESLNNPEPGCPVMGTCSGLGPAAPLPCMAGAAADIDTGIVRVACGWRRVDGVLDDPSNITTSGSRYASVRMTLVR